ncbi:MAG: fumarate hydratase, class II [Candidatus Epulonipiscioides saccharophilum]|nr:MAG: fumarate hydratase, class II [Epulopiscium sp. AS2M-Bin001]
MKYRLEKDSMGEIKVEEDKLWGAQTQRSLENFAIGNRKMPSEMIWALAMLKKVCAFSNVVFGKLEPAVAEEIGLATNMIMAGNLSEHFPLSIYQTGSGTQTNMNLNEVIANYVNAQNKTRKVHPNDDVNKSQSSNDIFPSAMHISAVKALHERLYPNLEKLSETFAKLSWEYKEVIKIGRTHLQDATPITFGQEVSAWTRMLDNSLKMIKDTEKYLYELPIGGTAVGTGLNAPAGFGDLACELLSEEIGYNFVSADNKFHALSSKDSLVNLHGSLKTLATSLMKIANDVRWLACGPRAGINEIKIPENEPGSSIMPGKVNPTQCEALTMVATRVFGNDVTIGLAGASGNFQLNVFMPILIDSLLESINLLSDSICSFNDNCAVGILPNHDQMEKNLTNSLMLVTALNPYIGYDKAAEVAKFAFEKGINLQEAAIQLNIVTQEAFQLYVNPKKMI